LFFEAAPCTVNCVQLAIEHPSVFTTDITTDFARSSSSSQHQ